MSDSISREQAINSICVNTCGKSHNDCGFWKQNYRYCYACKFARLVESTPSAEKTGRWKCIDLDNFGKYKVICPFCGAEYVDNYDGYVDTYMFNYCPNCGTRMED